MEPVGLGNTSILTAYTCPKFSLDMGTSISLFLATLLRWSNDRGEPRVSYSWTGWVQDFRRITDDFRGVYGIYLKLMYKNLRMWTCKQPVGLANTRQISTDYAPKFPWWSLRWSGLIVAKRGIVAHHLLVLYGRWVHGSRVHLRTHERFDVEG